ncbi:MAG: phospho-N-acetylmuramoyl-pentapeptide-transferase [Pirellulales bacterium]|nr:phospho-N-acetylmuramoyl-pentapeptide-transferase [Pirellulales bacterium]
MLLWLLNSVGYASWPALGKITLRGSVAAMLGFVLALALGPWMIRWLRARFREPNRSPSPEIELLHRDKEATPTMGGLFLVAGLVVGSLLLADLHNTFVQTALFTVVGLTALGAWDDLAKLRGRGHGLSSRAKLAGQLLIATVAAVALYYRHAASGDGPVLHVPLTNFTVWLGPALIPLAVLVIVGSSNAVNLADGLDGLAGGCLIFAMAAVGAVAYAAGHAVVADYLGVTPVAGAGEMVVVAGAAIGGLMGFLWFNCHPAQVFMGDTGSLPLGGLLGVIAISARQELLLVLIGGVFVLEAVSVIIQVGVYRWRRRRVFLCAPIHHHFQLRGWPETRIVTRFWIAGALCALVGVASLKLRIHESEPAPLLTGRGGATAGLSSSAGTNTTATSTAGQASSGTQRRKKGTGAICAKHPPGRSGKLHLSPFFSPTTGPPQSGEPRNFLPLRDVQPVQSDPSRPELAKDIRVQRE